MWNQVRHQGATYKANKKYFQRRIPTQTEKYLKHNKWNLDIQMREIRKLKTNLSDLNLEFMEDTVEQKLKNLKSVNEKLKAKMEEFYEYQIDPELGEDKLVQLEDRSRRCNLRIDGVNETSTEMWEKWKEHLETLFKDKLGVEENTIIESAHRKKSSPEGRSIKLRTIFCKFHNYKEKVKV